MQKFENRSYIIPDFIPNLWKGRLLGYETECDFVLFDEPYDLTPENIVICIKDCLLRYNESLIISRDIEGFCIGLLDPSDKLHRMTIEISFFTL